MYPTQPKPRAIVIGLDGVPYSLLEALSANGVMPNYRDLIRQGTLTKMRSSLPANSAVSWSSMITGENPGRHAVYGFTDFIRNTYTVGFHSSTKLKAKPFWDRHPSLGYIVVNLPATYPAQRIRGALVTGFVTPSLAQAAHPSSLLPYLRKIEYQVDVEACKAVKPPASFIDELKMALEKRVTLIDHLLKAYPCDLLFLVITGTDRVLHHLYESFEDTSHEHHEDFLGYFRAVDEAVGHVLGLVGDVPLMSLSDHGMGPVEVSFNVNAFLRESGYLELEANHRKNYNGIKASTRAFAAESHKVYLNLRDRFPRGCVPASTAPEVKKGLREELLSQRWRGRRVLKEVHFREDIYRGPYVTDAPDLVLVPSRGFSLKTGLHKESLFEEDRLTGTHTEDDAFLLLRDVDKGVCDPCIEDAFGILDNMLGV